MALWHEGDDNTFSWSVFFDIDLPTLKFSFHK
jgi:hypothetical protein